ncbi:DUF6414 family protein [Glutamicibacter protophormiae]|uniref:Uncharacterized protein n=1 Tax=Glutamicibacter protophormiae TaxID=37930 RepID=A0ABS4XN12_GLUPR|nr:hypothetical protein [Glutamicibacter protophormiae]MBP2397916.1 hypothetical protein [Glutamicibacter protophormiae]GGL97443.1 hypothetical protein GCM10010038_29520 [Glutamicibacter protophormiae]
MFLREYIYVDFDKVKGLASQLYDGVPEKATNISARQKQLGVDLKLFNARTQAGSEDAVERNLGDSLFKDLETDLESLGLLVDKSEALQNLEAWESDPTIYPGQIIRITAPGTLFHPNQMAEALVGVATAGQGLSEMGIRSEEEKVNLSKAKGQQQKGGNRNHKPPMLEPRFPEDLLPTVETIPMLGIARGELSGIIKILRGVFGEGVHLHLRPAGKTGPAISARLEQGRQFLDSSPEVLFSRYGLHEQDWTLVGMIGQIGATETDSEISDVTDENGNIARARFVDVVSGFMDATSGFVDLPQAPGFSVVPLAVYRGIGVGIEPEGSR